MKYLQISLASFCDGKSQKNCDLDAKEIGKNIIDQIYFQIPRKKTVFSQFRQIRNLGKWSYRAFYLILFFLLVVYSQHSALPLLLKNYALIQKVGILSLVKRIDFDHK